MGKEGILLWGATGFTGKCCAEYLATYYPPDKASFTWALGGRTLSKLEDVKNELVKINSSCSSIQLCTADTKQQETIDEMIKKFKVVISTAGPFALAGTPIVQACVKNNVHYCDITGETLWVRKMIAQFHDEAQKNSTFIVPFCGFDSIPSDMGAFMMRDYVNKNLDGRKCQQITYYVTKMKNPKRMAGGTFRTALNMFEETLENQKIANSVYALSDRKSRPPRSNMVWPSYSKEIKKWYGYFLMSSINTPVVYRSKMLNGYEEELHYNEYMASNSMVTTMVMTFLFTLGFIFLRFGWIRSLVNRLLPVSGEGPTKEELKGCYFTGLYIAKTIPRGNEKPKTVYGKIVGEGDAGYRETSKMVCESGICLLTQMDEILAQGKKGGVLTPASAMGDVLLKRLRQARMVFEVTEVKE